ncbi:sulfatase-like hydrolase/transferase [Tropicimonas sp. TH_r6]|uniref:sulfatase-like hydrolase/transferase n=1 Tax=Tropicimonas sp. TH_r6 TaxID=3082085 RepID=UPI002954F152|nr:sulfatase-like hydrolase/transferase [Tropicimonas sp. TH_r6]MDV7145397.1 sulfatase-like hydrolase/transferase [Tropicimonas sp. TH_r6]
MAAVCALSATSGTAQDGEIIRDGEYRYLEAQFGDEWAEQDTRIDGRLNEIWDANVGTPPNILYILIDDVSFGQMGSRRPNYVTGIDTPNINQFAQDGLSLMRMYTEPSCTPTRTAFLTGRHPIRAGVEEVKVALVGEGLSAEEVTLPEVLKQAGYNTAHVGKWHQGDIEEAYPNNQGFDWAAFPLHQQVQLSLMTREAKDANNMLGYHLSGQSNQFGLDQRFRPYGLVTGVEGEAGGMVREVDMEPGEEWTQAKYEEMNERYQRQILEQLDRLAGEEEPFFLQYWPLYPLNFAYPDQAISRNGGFHADKLQLLDEWIGDLLARLEETGEADNAIVMLMADNGLMYHYEGTSGLNQLIYRGGKTQHLEGGVRTDAFIRWPGVIEPDSAVGDIVHVSDLFTTFARIGNAMDFIPKDRVIDGLDQTPLLLEGEGNSRRDYVYVYEGTVLRSVVKQEFKMHLPAPGVPGAAAPVYNILRDPREEHSQIGNALWSGASFQDMVKRHQKMIAKYPHLPLGKGVPYEGIENLRPESELAREVFSSWQ